MAQVFQRRWHHRWIVAPIFVACSAGLLWHLVQAPKEGDLIEVAILAGCIATVLGLLLPPRWAVWPFRVLAGLMSLALLNIAFKDWTGSTAASSFGGDGGEKLVAVKPAFIGVLALWFAITGRAGLGKDQKQRIVDAGSPRDIPAKKEKEISLPKPHQPTVKVLK